MGLTKIIPDLRRSGRNRRGWRLEGGNRDPKDTAHRCCAGGHCNFNCGARLGRVRQDRLRLQCHADQGLSNRLRGPLRRRCIRPGDRPRSRLGWIQLPRRRPPEQAERVSRRRRRALGYCESRANDELQVHWRSDRGPEAGRDRSNDGDHSGGLLSSG